MLWACGQRARCLCLSRGSSMEHPPYPDIFIPWLFHKSMELLTQPTWGFYLNNYCTESNCIMFLNSMGKKALFSSCHCPFSEKSPKKHVHAFPLKLACWHPDKCCQTLLALNSGSTILLFSPYGCQRNSSRRKKLRPQDTCLRLIYLFKL